MSAASPAVDSVARREPLSVLTAMTVIAVVGEYSLLIMPFILTAMMATAGVSEAAGGQLISLQLFAMAAGSLLVSLLAPTRRLPVLAAALLSIVIANALCATTSSVSVLLAGRLLSGLGEGATMALAAGIIAATPGAHRTFSLVGLVVAVTAFLALVAIPDVMALLGPRGIFWMLCLVPVLALAVLPWLPGKQEALQNAWTEDAPAVATRASARQILLRPAYLAILCALALLWIGAGGLWVFAERIGATIGLTLGATAYCLAVGQLVGAAGPLAADRWGLSLGLRRALFAGHLMMAAGGLLFVFGGEKISYTLGASLLSFFIMFLVPCFRSHMAQLDPSGRLVSASGAFYTLGFAAAPAAVSLVLGLGGDYSTVALFSGLCFVLASLLVVVPAARD